VNNEEKRGSELNADFTFSSSPSVPHHISISGKSECTYRAVGEKWKVKAFVKAI
jgi:hypothetical protein